MNKIQYIFVCNEQDLYPKDKENYLSRPQDVLKYRMDVNLSYKQEVLFWKVNIKLNVVN